MRSFLLPGALFVVGCSAGGPPPAVPAWPDAARVEKITATVFGSITGESDVPEFELPPEFVPDVMRVLSPPGYHKHPRAELMREVGRLEIICRDGRELDVRLWYFGKEPVLFTLQGVPCIRGGPYIDLASGKVKYLPEVLTLTGFLRAVKSGDLGGARKSLELLDKSAGRTKSNTTDPAGM